MNLTELNSRQSGVFITAMGGKSANTFIVAVTKCSRTGAYPAVSKHLTGPTASGLLQQQPQCHFMQLSLCSLDFSYLHHNCAEKSKNDS